MQARYKLDGDGTSVLDLHRLTSSKLILQAVEPIKEPEVTSSGCRPTDA